MSEQKKNDKKNDLRKISGIENVDAFLAELNLELGEFEELINDKKFQECANLDDSINSKVDRIKNLVLLGDHKFTEKQAVTFTQLMRENEKFHDKYRAERAKDDLNKGIDSLNNELEEIKQLKNNFINMLGIFAGMIGFIFLNFNIFKDIGNLPIKNIVTVITLLNVVFISGIIVLCVLLKTVISKEKLDTEPLIKIMAFYTLIALMIILILTKIL